MLAASRTLTRTAGCARRTGRAAGPAAPTASTVHRRLRELRIAEGDDQPFTNADDHRSHHDAPERAEPADHDHDEGRRYDLGCPSPDGSTKIGASMTPARPASPTPRKATAAMYGSSEMPSAPTMSGFCTPARTTRPNGVRCSRNHRPATQAAATAQHQQPIIRINEVADEELAAQLRRDRVGQRRRAEDHAQAPARRPSRGRRSASATASDRPCRSGGIVGARSTTPRMPTSTGEATSAPPKPMRRRRA